MSRPVAVRHIKGCRRDKAVLFSNAKAQKRTNTHKTWRGEERYNVANFRDSAREGSTIYISVPSYPQRILPFFILPTTALSFSEKCHGWRDTRFEGRACHIFGATLLATSTPRRYSVVSPDQGLGNVVSVK